VTYWCERNIWGHRQTISILSRNNTLSQTYLTKIYRNVHKMGLSTSHLSIINQEECEEPQLNENGFAINKPWNHQITDYSPHEAINSDDDKYWRWFNPLCHHFIYANLLSTYHLFIIYVFISLVPKTVLNQKLSQIFMSLFALLLLKVFSVLRISMKS
jgi:hypothetical protein